MYLENGRIESPVCSRIKPVFLVRIIEFLDSLDVLFLEMIPTWESISHCSFIIE